MQKILNQEDHAIVYNSERNYLSLQFPFGYLHLSEFKKENVTRHSSYYDDGRTASYYFVKELGLGEHKKELTLTRLSFDDKSVTAISYESAVINVPEFFADKLAMFFSGLIKGEDV